MSEAQSPTATLSVDVELSAKDVELLHKIVVRAQDEPQGTDRNSLLTAYQAILHDRELDPAQDDVFFWLLLEILRPGVEGQTLPEKFDHVMRNKGIEVVFDDDASTRGSAHSHVDRPATRQLSISSGHISEASHQSSQDIADLGVDANSYDLSLTALDNLVDHPPAHVARLEHIAEVHIRKTLLTLAFDTWRDEAASKKRSRDLRMMEQYADYIYERHLRYKVFTHWQTLQQQIIFNHHTADDFYLRHKNGAALTTLWDTARVNRVQAMEDVRLRGLGLYKWAVASRENGFRRKLDHKLKKQCMSAMLIALRSTVTQKNELEGRFATTRQKSGERNAGVAFRMIYYASQRAHQNYDLSCDQYDVRLKRTAMNTWSGKTHQAIDAYSMAENAHKASLIREYFAKIQEVAIAQRQRREVLAKWVLKRWRSFTVKSRETRYCVNYRQFRSDYKARRARLCLQKMLIKARTAVDMQQQAIEHSNTNANARTQTQARELVRFWYRIAHTRKQQNEAAVEFARQQSLGATWKALVEKQQQVQHLERVGESFLDLHAQAVSRRCLKNMSRKAFEIRRRQQDADAFRDRHERQMLRSRWDEWRRRVAEKLGEGPLVLPPATPAQRRADQLNRLASTTPLFAPRTSFAARLRGDIAPTESTDEDFEENK